MPVPVLVRPTTGLRSVHILYSGRLCICFCSRYFLAQKVAAETEGLCSILIYCFQHDKDEKGKELEH